MIKIEFLWKDSDSNVGGCPSLSRVSGELNGYFVVGKETDPSVRPQIPEVGDDELVVFVPANVIDRVRDL